MSCVCICLEDHHCNDDDCLCDFECWFKLTRHAIFHIVWCRSIGLHCVYVSLAFCAATPMPTMKILHCWVNVGPRLRIPRPWDPAAYNNMFGLVKCKCGYTKRTLLFRMWHRRHAVQPRSNTKRTHLIFNYKGKNVSRSPTLRTSKITMVSHTCTFFSPSMTTLARCKSTRM